MSPGLLKPLQCNSLRTEKRTKQPPNVPNTTIQSESWDSIRQCSQCGAQFIFSMQAPHAGQNSTGSRSGRPHFGQEYGSRLGMGGAFMISPVQQSGHHDSEEHGNR
jgi:hypothetical protein